MQLIRYLYLRLLSLRWHSLRHLFFLQEHVSAFLLHTLGRTWWKPLMWAVFPIYFILFQGHNTTELMGFLSVQSTFRLSAELVILLASNTSLQNHQRLLRLVMISWSRNEPRVTHEWLKLLESLGKLSTNHYGNKHILSSFIGILSISESRICHISWLLFADCTIILPYVYSWSILIVIVVNLLLLICNTIRCNINFQ